MKKRGKTIAGPKDVRRTIAGKEQRNVYSVATRRFDAGNRRVRKRDTGVQAREKVQTVTKRGKMYIAGSFPRRVNVGKWESQWQCAGNRLSNV